MISLSEGVWASAGCAASSIRAGSTRLIFAALPGWAAMIFRHSSGVGMMSSANAALDDPCALAADQLVAIDAGERGDRAPVRPAHHEEIARDGAGGPAVGRDVDLRLEMMWKLARLGAPAGPRIFSSMPRTAACPLKLPPPPVHSPSGANRAA